MTPPAPDEEAGTRSNESDVQSASDVECAICFLKDTERASPLHRTACGHAFCESCLVAYVDSTQSTNGEAGVDLSTLSLPCPLCRTPLPAVDLPHSSFKSTLHKARHTSSREELQQMLFCAPIICCCLVMGQLWQKIMGKPKWVCGALALFLWFLFAVGIVVDAFAAEVVDKWAHQYDYTDGIIISEISVITAPLSVLLFWLLTAALLRCMRNRLKRDAPDKWERATRGLNPRATCSAGSEVCGPLFCGVCLAGKMLAAVSTNPSDEYSLCVPLEDQAEGDHEPPPSPPAPADSTRSADPTFAQEPFSV